MIIEARNLCVNFGKTEVIKDLCFEVEKGQKITLAGASGMGKTTILNVLLGFVEYQQGEVWILNRLLNKNNIHSVRSHTAWLPQELNYQFDTVGQLFYAPFDFRANQYLKPTSNEVDMIFRQFGLENELLDKKLSEISGGQKQRICLASCALLKKPLLLLDEPTSALDSNSKEKIMDYLFALKNLTIIASSHDPQWIERSNKVITLQ